MPPVVALAATPVPAPPSYQQVALAPPTPTGIRAVRRRRGGGRFLGTAAVLVLAGVAAVPLYRRLPWSLRAQITPASAPAQAPAPPVNPLTAAAAPPAPTEAESKAARARAALIKVAEAELDSGELEAGVEHYKAAAKLAPEESDTAALAEAIRLRALAALVQGHDAEAAVRLARQGLVVAGDQAPAHALLADMLYAARDYQESVAEYRAALEGAPDDAVLKRGLDRARKKLGQDKAKAAASSPRPRPRSRAAAAGAEASPAEDKAADTETASPPSEPAAE